MMPMRRRRFITACTALAAAPWARAQQGRQYRIGWIGTSATTFGEPYSVAFVQRLAALGFVEKRNLVIDRRHGDNRVESLPKIAAAMAANRYDLLFTGGPEANLAAATQISRDVPIVVVAVDFDPLATGDVASLARPGGRVTGVSAQQATLPAKRLELLKEMLPKARKVGVLTNELAQGQLTVVQGTARRMGLALHIADLKRPPFDLPAAFAGMVREKCDAVFVVGSALFVPMRRDIPGLAAKSRLPSTFHQAQWVELGGLMSYGFSFVNMWRRGAEMAASILRGAKAADTPMEVPASFELAVNLATARTLGVSVPQAMLVRADRVIE
jgi:putative tryptophan/tyrosine transport system substrate-binding protein